MLTAPKQGNCWTPDGLIVGHESLADTVIAEAATSLFASKKILVRRPVDTAAYPNELRK